MGETGLERRRDLIKFAHYFFFRFDLNLTLYIRWSHAGRFLRIKPAAYQKCRETRITSQTVVA
jgi:hypothetical protein